jgi:hypothetical protein
MATVTGKHSSLGDPQVYHPLDQLRGTIRRYVIIEGVLSALIFLAAWYTIAMVIDFGMFKAFGWDWVQDGNWWIRAVVLAAAIILLGSIVAFRIVRRLTTEFTYPALALVLERRFPKVLGDRLITAVELADVEKAARYGYSADMIRQTISEARTQVARVPVNEVFDWRRLRIMGIVAVGLPLAVVIAAFASYMIATDVHRLGPAGWKFVHVTTILAERDLLLENTPWPRRALLELEGVSDSGIRVSRDAAAPRLRVRSYQWVIADSGRTDGWRPLLWSDVTESLVGKHVPELPYSQLNLPEEKVALPADAEAWPVDAVWERVRENSLIRGRLTTSMRADDYLALQDVLDRLDEIANSPSWARSVRRLDRPDAVTFVYAGQRTGGGGTLNPEGSGRYTGEIAGLREDVQFMVKAEDYRTPSRAITLVPPPSLKVMTKVEYQPAYLHYGPPQVPDPNNPKEMVSQGYSALKGLRQRMPEEKVSLTGDKSVFAVPAGTEVVITAATELPISRAMARPKVGKLPGAKPGSADLIPLQLIDDHTFTMEFKGDARLTSAVEFDLLFENSDRVVSSRPILIQVTEDQAPTVEVAPEVIRRVGNVFYVTPRAKIPFNPESYIKDDNGLSKLEYTAAYWQEDSAVGRVMRAGLVTRMLIVPMAAGPTAPILSSYHAGTIRSLDKGDSRLNASFGLSSFRDKESGVRSETREWLLKLLAEPLAGDKVELVRQLGLKTELRATSTRTPAGRLEAFKWTIDGDYFDVKALGLEVPEGDVQPRYMIELNVRATDTNVDTGPKVSSNPEPMRLLVVSQGDLLVEISKDEEALGVKVDEALKKLEAARRKYEFVRSKNGQPAMDEVDVVKVRARDAMQDVVKSREAIQSVIREYRRIEKECVFNQIKEETTIHYGEFANRVDRVLGENPLPVSVSEDRTISEQDELIRLGKREPRASFAVTEKLMALVQAPLDESRWSDPIVLADAENSLVRLIREVSDIRKAIGEAESYDQLKRRLSSAIEEQKRIRLELVRWKKFLEDDATRDAPRIDPVGAVFMTKGETKKIKHNISWRQFKEDNLVVKLTSSDPTAVIVPAELKLDFEKNDLSFEYEVRAASKDGEYTVTLTPAVGDKVEVKITVK